MISKKCKYAIHAMVYMAKTPTLQHTIQDISEKCHVPKKFLEAILLELKKSGILTSKLGKGGGYSLRLSPAEINLAEVIRLFDGAIAAVPCASYKFYVACDECEDEETCTGRHSFLELRNATVELLKGQTMESMVRQEQKLVKKKGLVRTKK
jgi:Rrf2 family protein